MPASFFSPCARPQFGERRKFAIAAALFAHGILLEGLQEVFVPGRGFELSDIVANGLGIMLAGLLMMFLRARANLGTWTPVEVIT